MQTPNVSNVVMKLHLYILDNIRFSIVAYTIWALFPVFLNRVFGIVPKYSANTNSTIVSLDIIAYEIFWYFAIALLVASQYIIKRLMLNKIRIDIEGTLSDEMKKLFASCYCIISVFVVTYLIFCGDSPAFPYGLPHRIELIFSALLLLEPSFFNMFLVVVAFYGFFKKEFESSQDLTSLFKAGELIHHLKSINYYFFVSYITFYVFSLIAFNSINLISDALSDLKNGAFTQTVITMVVYLFFPLILSLGYYTIVIRQFKFIIIKAISNVLPRNFEHADKVFYLFFDPKSEYHLNNVLPYTVSTFFIPAVSLAANILIELLEN